MFALAVAAIVMVVGSANAAQTAQPEQQWSVTNGPYTLTAIHIYSPDPYTLGFVITLSGLHPGDSLGFGNFGMTSQQISHYYCPGPNGTRLNGGTEDEGSLAEAGGTLGDGPFVANAQGVVKVTVFQSDRGYYNGITAPECTYAGYGVATKFDFYNIAIDVYAADGTELTLPIPGVIPAHGKCPDPFNNCHLG